MNFFEIKHWDRTPGSKFYEACELEKEDEKKKQFYWRAFVYRPALQRDLYANIELLFKVSKSFKTLYLFCVHGYLKMMNLMPHQYIIITHSQAGLGLR